jgi:hypothetical protein
LRNFLVVFALCIFNVSCANDESTSDGDLLIIEECVKAFKKYDVQMVDSNIKIQPEYQGVRVSRYGDYDYVIVQFGVEVKQGSDYSTLRHGTASSHCTVQEKEIVEIKRLSTPASGHEELNILLDFSDEEKKAIQKKLSKDNTTIKETHRLYYFNNAAWQFVRQE